MIKATMIPAMMHSAYARSGNAPMYQMFVLGLGMDRTACAHDGRHRSVPMTPTLPSLPVARDRQPTLAQVSYALGYLWLALVIIALSASGVRVAISPASH